MGKDWYGLGRNSRPVPKRRSGPTQCTGGEPRPDFGAGGFTTTPISYPHLNGSFHGLSVFCGLRRYSLFYSFRPVGDRESLWSGKDFDTVTQGGPRDDGGKETSVRLLDRPEWKGKKGSTGVTSRSTSSSKLPRVVGRGVGGRGVSLLEDDRRPLVGTRTLSPPGKKTCRGGGSRAREPPEFDPTLLLRETTVTTPAHEVEVRTSPKGRCGRQVGGRRSYSVTSSNFKEELSDSASVLTPLGNRDQSGPRTLAPFLLPLVRVPSPVSGSGTEAEGSLERRNQFSYTAL